MRRCVAVLALAVLAALPVVPAAAAEADRVAGASRFDTAVAIAQRAFPDGADTVYLARADLLADALAAGTLSDGPVLLVPSCGDIPETVVEEVDRLEPSEVVALGGEQAVCDTTLERLGGDADTERLAGEGRIGTAIAISQRAFDDGASTVYLAGADDSPDAVAGGSLSDGPILLVPSTGDPGEAVSDEIDRLDPTEVVALGGQAAVAGDTLEAAADGRRTDRIAGASRIETAVAIAAVSFPDTADTVYLARADVFADAVAAGSLTDGPVLLVPSCARVPSSVLDALDRLAADDVVALGGTAAVCDGLLETAARGGDGLGELLFTRSGPDQSISTGTIWTVAPSGSGAAQLSPDPAAGASQGGHSWSPDGRHVAYIDLAENDLRLVVIDTLDADLAPFQPFDPVAELGHPCLSVGYIWMPDSAGLVVVCTADEGTAFLQVGLDGSVRRIPLADPAAAIESYSVAPDGASLIFVEARGDGDDVERQTLRADLTTDPIAVTALDLPAVDPVHSPDGAEIYYIEETAPGEPASIRAVRPDGSGDREVAPGIPGEGERFFLNAFTPNGDLIVNVLDEIEPEVFAARRVVLVDAATGTTETVVSGGVGATAVSPDGDRLAVTFEDRDEQGQLTGAVIAVVDLASGEVTELPSDGRRDYAARWRSPA